MKHDKDNSAGIPGLNITEFDHLTGSKEMCFSSFLVDLEKLSKAL